TPSSRGPVSTWFPRRPRKAASRRRVEKRHPELLAGGSPPTFLRAGGLVLVVGRDAGDLPRVAGPAARRRGGARARRGLRFGGVRRRAARRRERDWRRPGPRGDPPRTAPWVAGPERGQRGGAALP